MVPEAHALPATAPGRLCVCVSDGLGAFPSRPKTRLLLSVLESVGGVSSAKAFILGPQENGVVMCPQSATAVAVGSACPTRRAWGSSMAHPCQPPLH